MDSHDTPFWKEVTQDEMHSIMENNTWVLVNLNLLHQSGSLKRKRE